MKKTRVALVLFNLGAPDSPVAIRPFLFNLFNDAAIIDLPQPLRWCLAKLIAGRRFREAEKIYARLGGSSPLLVRTREQATALERALADLGEVRAFVAMRYWHPMSEETASEVRRFSPDRVVLLPLYPQFSTTTTASSLREWRHAVASEGLTVPTWTVCCYPTVRGLVKAHAALIRDGLGRAEKAGNPRLLFSAHGLPKRVLARGDPYVWQVECMAGAVAGELASDFPDLDWRVCYQSRVGPLEWVGPSTEEEIRRAGRDRAPVVVVPIAFVSEHSETLVELDITTRGVAAAAGVPAYVRVPALGTGAMFIGALVAVVRRLVQSGPGICSAEGRRICPLGFAACPLAMESDA